MPLRPGLSWTRDARIASRADWRGGLAQSYRSLLGKAKAARVRAASYYNQAMTETKFEPGDRVLLWSNEVASQEGKKVVKPWIGPYVVVAPLGRVGYEIKSEVGNKVARVHANRLRKIGDGVVETGDPKNGVFPDSFVC